MITNIFEQKTGAVNIAPIKVSGQYKLVVSNDGNIYFDDYTGRRILVDFNKPFLPQLSNFLKTKTNIINLENLRYGAFQYNNIKTYHAPFYFGNDYPRFFNISKTLDSSLQKDIDIYRYCDIINLFDLKKIGLFKIFDEINNMFDDMLYFNLEDKYIDIIGYSINEDSKISVRKSIIDLLANQNYLDVVNNKILNLYKNNDIVYPRFMNIEFEFKYNIENNILGNFIGFYSYVSKVSNDNLNLKETNIVFEEYQDSIIWKQILNKQPELTSYKDIIGNCSVKKLTNKQPQIRMKVNGIITDTVFKLINPDKSSLFEYKLSSKKIISLYDLCNKLTKASKRMFNFTVEKDIITVMPNFYNGLMEEYSIEIPESFVILDRYKDNSNYNYFRGITDYDLQILGNLIPITDIVYLSIDSNEVSVSDKFKYNGYDIIRLNQMPDRYITNVFILECKNQEILNLKSIPLLSYYNNLECDRLFDITKYCDSLKQKFGDEKIFADSVDDFLTTTKYFISEYPYVKEVNGELIPENKIELDLTNESNVLNILLNYGCTDMIQPNILNIDKQFYIDNFNNRKFNWFLIKGECPSYLNDTVYNLRYFKDIPNLTSTVKRINTNYSETTFLGIKYQLPNKYVGYQFSVYLNPNNSIYNNTEYRYEINDIGKTIYLVINRYIDFTDLIRGANPNNEPLIDLSLFYSIRKSYNTTSNNLSNFKTGGVLMFESTIPVNFVNNNLTDWKIKHTDNKWYICLKRSTNIITDYFKTLFPKFGDSEFYVYSTLNIDGTDYNYISMKIIIKNIHTVENDYIWCEDVIIRFFDSKQFFVNINNKNYLVDKDKDFLTIENDSTNVFGDNVKSTEVIVNGLKNRLKLLLPDKDFSIKENYFELINNVYYDSNGVKHIERDLFIFNESIVGKTYDEIFDKFNVGSTDDFQTSKITLLDRNQIWRFIKDILMYNSSFKYNTETQIENYMNELLLSNFVEYSNLKNIKVINSENTVKTKVINKDINAVIWEISDIPKIYNIERVRGYYNPCLKDCKNIFEFQINDFKKDNTIKSSFDTEGYFSEIYGNIVSTLYLRYSDINLTTEFSEKLNYFEVFRSSVNYSDIIKNLNTRSLFSIERSEEEKQNIVEQYVYWVFNNFYKLSYVCNENNERIIYKINNENPFIIEINNTKYSTINNIKLCFKRK